MAAHREGSAQLIYTTRPFASSVGLGNSVGLRVILCLSPCCPAQYHTPHNLLLFSCSRLTHRLRVLVPLLTYVVPHSPQPAAGACWRDGGAVRDLPGVRGVGVSQTQLVIDRSAHGSPLLASSMARRGSCQSITMTAVLCTPLPSCAVQWKREASKGCLHKLRFPLADPT